MPTKNPRIQGKGRLEDSGEFYIPSKQVSEDVIKLILLGPAPLDSRASNGGIPSHARATDGQAAGMW